MCDTKIITLTLYVHSLRMAGLQGLWCKDGAIALACIRPVRKIKHSKKDPSRPTGMLSSKPWYLCRLAGVQSRTLAFTRRQTIADDCGTASIHACHEHHPTVQASRRIIAVSFSGYSGSLRVGESHHERSSHA